MKILIADDAGILRQRMISLLSSVSGIRTIFEADDCSSTLASIERDRPDVVVLDLCLPDGSGLDVLHAMENVADRPEFFVLTTLGDEEVRKRCLDAGATRFFEKGTEFLGAVEAIEALAAGAAE